MSVSPIESIPTGEAPRLPPEISGLPVLGLPAAMLHRPFAFLSEARDRLGDIFTLNVGQAKYVVLNHPRHTEQVLITNAQNYVKGDGVWNSIRAVMGNGLAVSEGDFWLRQRRMMQPHFHRQRLAALTEVMVETTDYALTAWNPKIGTDGSFNIQNGFAAVTIQFVTRALFGRGVAPATIDLVADHMSFVLDYLAVGSVIHGLPDWLPIPGARRLKWAMAEINKAVLQIITDERAAATPSDSLLAMLIEMVDDQTGEGMTDGQLRDEVMTLFLAGYKTTSLALTWTAAYLTQHLDILARLRAEIDTVLGKRPPTFADLPKLNYTKMVLYEAMRLRPPSWWVPRTALADDIIDGYHIPAGTTVVSYTHGIHNNPTIWPNPERFDPERFTPERIAARHRLAWAPFGAGQRQCIGRDFAIMEGQIILARLLQRFELVPLPGMTVEPGVSGMLRPKRPTTVQLLRRG